MKAKKTARTRKRAAASKPAKKPPAKRPLPLFTIGYEKSTPGALIDELKRAKVSLLVDTRAVAASRKPGFSKRQLAASFDENGIRYLHLQKLGTPAEGREAARKGDTATLWRIYDKHVRTPAARAEMDELVGLVGSGARICLLCFERDVDHCHRKRIAESCRSEPASPSRTWPRRCSEGKSDLIAILFASGGTSGQFAGALPGDFAMTLADMLGYIAAVLVFASFAMRTMVPLRLVGIASNVFFIAYGYVQDAVPVLILHCVLLPLNVFRLQQMLSLVRQVEVAAKGDLNMDWLKPFTTRLSIPAGETLFAKGDRADAMYFVMNGTLTIPAIGMTVDSGNVVGELGFLSPKQVRTQTVLAAEPAELLKITYDQVRQLYFQNPKFGFYFMQLSSRRLFENVERLERELSVVRSAPA